MAFAIA